jgi:hypothetical protein
LDLAVSKEVSTKRYWSLLSVEDKELAAQNLSHAELRKQMWELTRHNKTESSKVLSDVQTAAKEKTSETKLWQEQFTVFKAIRPTCTNWSTRWRSRRPS